VTWLDVELVLVALAAMLSPTTLTFSVLTLVLSERPLRGGLWFYAGAVAATLAMGVIAALVLDDAAASADPSSPKTWVAVVDVCAGMLLLGWLARVLRRRDPARAAKMLAKMRSVTASPAIAIAGAGATLANPGAFIPIALKSISELDPSRGQYVVDWLFFTVVSLLPLAVALVLLGVAPGRATTALAWAREWLELRARAIGAVLVVVRVLALLRNGIAGLTA
jgi:hypothetical protein